MIIVDASGNFENQDIIYFAQEKSVHDVYTVDVVLNIPESPFLSEEDFEIYECEVSDENGWNDIVYLRRNDSANLLLEAVDEYE